MGVYCFDRCQLQMDFNVPALEATKRTALLDVLSSDSQNKTCSSHQIVTLLFGAAEFRGIHPALKLRLHRAFVRAWQRSRFAWYAHRPGGFPGLLRKGRQSLSQ